MDDSVSAALSIERNVLRYAELERRDDGVRLLRHGEERASSDLTRSLLRADGDPEHTRRVKALLGARFDDTSARDLRVTVHPPDSYSFFTPISSDAPVRDRKRQLLQKAALVTGVRSTESLHMTSETVRTAQDSDGEPFMWVHVLAVPDAVDERMAEIVRGLTFRGHAWMVSSEAASQVISRLERAGGSAQEALRPYTLSVGQYPTHTEYALSRNREWYHAHYTEETESADNRVYFAVGFLNRVDVPLDRVGRLFVYGVDVDLEAYAPFERVFGQEPERLDPFRVVERGTGDPPSDPSAFAPCIGAGIGPYL
ncbi:MAG: hypothetical protein ABEL97_02215 [Salinibacter sp.]